MEIGAAVQSISRWEGGVTPTKLYRRALAGALGLSVEALMSGASPIERRQPVLQPLREIVARVQAVGEDALVDFVDRVVQLAHQDYLRARRK